MIKLLCPSCMKSISVPDEAAGTTVPCPECGKPFPVPVRYSPVVAAAPQPVPPPPPIFPEPAPNFTASPTVPAELPTGYTHSRGLTISPRVVAWIPAISLTAILLLTLTPWVGVFPDGHAVYTQGAWRSITGRPTHDFQLEEIYLKELPAPSVYDRTSADWLIMLPYMIALLLAVAVAWAERLEHSQVQTRLPRTVPTLWPHHHVLLAGLAGAALLILTIEATRGFGLERAMHAAVSEKFESARKTAGTSPSEQAKLDFREGRELAQYGIERTGWFCLVLTLHGLAVLAMVARVGLERRGNKPPPRIAIQY